MTVRNGMACSCGDCVERRKKEQDFLLDPFFTEVKKFCDEIEIQQILKGVEKYPHPFNPDDWNVEQLANHAMSENRDQAVYITGMRDRMRKQAEQIEYLKSEVEYWRLKALTAGGKQ